MEASSYESLNTPHRRFNRRQHEQNLSLQSERETKQAKLKMNYGKNSESIIFLNILKCKHFQLKYKGFHDSFVVKEFKIPHTTKEKQSEYDKNGYF